MVSVAHLLHMAHRNSNKIIKFIQHGGKISETFDPNTVNDPTKKEINMSSDDKKLLGIAIGVFITILLVGIVLWIISLVLLVKYWDRLTDAAKIIGVIGILPFVPVGPIFTFFAVIIGRKA